MNEFDCEKETEYPLIPIGRPRKLIAPDAIGSVATTFRSAFGCKRMGRQLRSAALPLVLAACASCLPLDGARAQEIQTAITGINIQAQPIRQALADFVRQTGIQVLFMDDGDEVRHITSRAVTASTPERALAQMLAGSGCHYKFVNSRTVSIITPSSEVPADTRRFTESNFVGTTELYNGSASDLNSMDAVGKSGDTDDAVRRDRALRDGSDAGSGESGEKARHELSEVVITGTHIEGTAPIGSAVKIYSRDDIDISGASTLDEFARQMTENFSGVDTIANQHSSNMFSRTNGPSGNNAFSGSAFDIHGLGAASTLTLLNGHRLAPGSQDGSIVDASQIPLSAIDHIEILTDGASAIYGTDAVSGVVNIVTRKQFRGAETNLRYAESSEGGAVEMSGSQLLGTSWKSGQGFVTYEYDRQNGLDAAERNYIGDQGGPYSLIPKNRRNSVLLSGSQELESGTRVSADGIYSRREFASQNTENSPIQFATSSAGGTVSQSAIAVNLDQDVGKKWRVSLGGEYSRISQTSDGTSSVSSAGYSNTSTAGINVDSSLYDVSLIASGPVLELPAGEMKMALGGDLKVDRFVSNTVIADMFSTQLYSVPAKQRHVGSLYSELTIPIVENPSPDAWTKSLSVSAAFRYDRDSDFGSTTNPKLGIVWEPIRSIDLRGTFGTSFRAPLLSQLYTPIQSSTFLYPDAASPAGFSDLLFVTGGNSALRAERSRSWSAGIDVKPAAVPALTLSATYFHIRFTERIATPPTGVAGNYLNDPLLSTFVTRNPPIGEVISLFGDPGFGGDFAGLGPSGVQAIFDNKFANISATRESGVDFAGQYGVKTAYGDFGVSFSATRLIDNDFQTSNGAPFYALLNTFGQPPKFRGRLGLTWARGPMTFGTFVNYVNSYANDLFSPPESVSSWTTADVHLAYRADRLSSSIPRGLTLTLDVMNITDRKPPSVGIPDIDLFPGQNPIPFDAANASPVGRLFSLGMSVHW